MASEMIMILLLLFFLFGFIVGNMLSLLMIKTIIHEMNSCIAEVIEDEDDDEGEDWWKTGKKRN